MARCRALRAPDASRQMLLERLAVGKLREAVVQRSISQFLRGAGPFRDVLLNGHPAALVGLFLANEDDASVLEAVEALRAERLVQNFEVLLGRLPAIGSVGDAQREYLTRVHAGAQLLRPQSIELGVTMVRDDEFLVRVEHRHALRDIVERKAEPFACVQELLRLRREPVASQPRPDARTRQAVGEPQLRIEQGDDQREADAAAANNGHHAGAPLGERGLVGDSDVDEKGVPDDGPHRHVFGIGIENALGMIEPAASRGDVLPLGARRHGLADQIADVRVPHRHRAVDVEQRKAGFSDRRQVRVGSKELGGFDADEGDAEKPPVRRLDSTGEENRPSASRLADERPADEEALGALVSQRREVFAIANIDLCINLVARRRDDVAGCVRHRDHIGPRHRRASRDELAADDLGVVAGYRFSMNDGLRKFRGVAQGEVERRRGVRHVFGQNCRHVAGIDGRDVDRVRAHLAQSERDDGGGENGEYNGDRGELRRPR